MSRQPASAPSTASLWLPLVLLVCGLLLRAFKLQGAAPDWTMNIAPWMALAFTGAIVSPRTLPWWSWAAILIVFDLVVQPGNRWAIFQEIWLVYACLAAAALLGGSLRGKIGFLNTLLGVAGCSIAFYLITNTQAWMMSAAYAKTFSGWFQAMTIGNPQASPTTLEFFRNSFLSDLGFSIILLVAARVPWTHGLSGRLEAGGGARPAF